jgi:hypothetical protein
MHRVFELKPILVAALLGAAVLALVGYVAGAEDSVPALAVAGGLTGAAVQVGVRVFRVS